LYSKAILIQDSTSQIYFSISAINIKYQPKLLQVKISLYLVCGSISQQKNCLKARHSDRPGRRNNLKNLILIAKRLPGHLAPAIIIKLLKQPFIILFYCF